jgi:hypothetical protein
MSLPSTIMTLAGCSWDDWSKEFEKYVTETSPSGSPLKGSMGIHYGLATNPCDLYESVDRNDAAFIKAFVALLHKDDKVPGKPTAAKLVLEFVKWALGSEDTFIIRKGNTAMYVAKRTSAIFADLTAEYSVRFHYTIVGPAPESVQKAIRSQNRKRPPTVFAINM